MLISINISLFFNFFKKLKIKKKLNFLKIGIHRKTIFPLNSNFSNSRHFENLQKNEFSNFFPIFPGRPMECKTRQLSKPDEAAQCHVELNRLYDMAKSHVDAIKTSAASEDRRQYVSDVKETQRLLRSIQTKINYLKTLAKEVSAGEKRSIDTNVWSHERQLGQLQRKFREYAEEVEKEMAKEERKSLLMSNGARERKPIEKTAGHKEVSALERNSGKIEAKLIKNHEN